MTASSATAPLAHRKDSLFQIGLRTARDTLCTAQEQHDPTKTGTCIKQHFHVVDSDGRTSKRLENSVVDVKTIAPSPAPSLLTEAIPPAASMALLTPSSPKLTVFSPNPSSTLIFFRRAARTSYRTQRTTKICLENVREL